MIGYYVHHVGHGHLSRATAIAAELKEPVTGLSALARPSHWPGEWIRLPRDDDSTAPDEADAGGRLHWAPLRDEGVRTRMAQISGWLAATAPAAFVSDVSVEIALLARLHGVPVVSMALPGRRDDAAHQLGFAVSSAILSAWPPEAVGMLEGLDESARRKHEAVGAISRFRVAPRAETGNPGGATITTLPGTCRRRVVVLNGRGGDDVTAESVRRARALTPGWEWDILGGTAGRWVENPWPLIRSADVVVTHAGEGAIAEVAAARRPAVVMAQTRPHDEQRHTAAVLTAEQWPATVVESFASTEWSLVLDEAARQNGEKWAVWNDGGGGARAAAVIERVASRGIVPASGAIRPPETAA